MSASVPEVVGGRSESGGAGGSGSSGGGGADWTCADSDCRHSNFARRTQCNKCERQRSPERAVSVGGGSTSGGGGGSQSKKKLGTEIGKAAAEKSRGLFSAEDWQCSKCANVNWARRLTCNMCNAPKFSDVEERTGYGGGYNDRGIVEYKERAESDSEYDEFGRLKKRKATDTHPKEGKHKRLHASNDEEGDESDEDDDGDLSKYDLWGDDEVPTATGVAAKASKDVHCLSKSSPNRSKTQSGIKSATATRSRSGSRGSRSSSSSTSSSSESSTSTSSSSSSSRSSRTHSSSARSRSRSRSSHRQTRCLSKDRSSRPNLTSLKPTKDKIRSRSRSRERSKSSPHFGRRR